ncbi:hypothetical protein [Enterobacter cancerogenus]|uniref:hypothetical protein n=1 Tax=Enterobacter cancerogenus TaxID=69218 RepID=UPI004057FE83
MENILQSIEKSLATENWISAIFASLTLPDICGATENKIQGNGARYRDWFNRYLKKKYDQETLYDSVMANEPELLVEMDSRGIEYLKSTPAPVRFTANDCWALRNACLHEGIDKDRLRKFTLTIPTKGFITGHLNSINGILQLDAKIFCEDIVKAARVWVEDMKKDADMKKKLDEMIKVKGMHLIFYTD